MNVSNPGRGRVCGLLLAALAFPLVAQAAPLSTLQINSARSIGNPLANVEQTQVSFGGTALPAEVSRDEVFTVNGTEFAVTAYAFASPEALRASGTLSATSGGSFVAHFHRVFAAVTDGLRIDSALYDGQSARVTYALDVSGMLDTTVDAGGTSGGAATARWAVDSGCATLGQCTAGSIGLTPGYSGSLQSLPGFTFPFGDETGLLSFTIEAAFGTEILISTVLEVSMQINFSNGSGGTFAAATADFSNTLVWGGIQSVTLLDGTLVTDWTSTSGSGFDYGSASVIPVPAAAWLFGSALLGLAGLRRRR